jgi:hypothetical protein
MLRTFLFFLLVSTSCFADNADKLAHFGLAGMATVGCVGAAKRFLEVSREDRWKSSLLCSLSVLALGVIKEATDHTGFGWEDMGANVAGAAAASLFVWTFEF